MHKMKKLVTNKKLSVLSMTAAVAICLAATGCSAKNNDSEIPTENAQVESQTTPTLAPTTAPLPDLQPLSADIFEYEKDNKETGVIITGIKDGTAVIEGILPNEIDGLPVVGMKDTAIDQKNSITSIEIKDGVTEIGIDAFRGCSSLISVSIPDSVTYIGDWAFAYCKLTNVKVPGSVDRIGQYAFMENVMESIEISSGVTCIEFCAFGGSTRIKDFTFPASVESMGEQCFDSYTHMTMHVPSESYAEQWVKGHPTGIDAVTSIEDAAPSVSSPILSEDLFEYEEKEDGVFITGVTSEDKCIVGTIPSTINDIPVVGISNEAFDQKRSRINVVIADGVTSIPENAFAWCESIRKLTIPEGVTTIGSMAFSGLTALPSVDLPDSIINIDNAAFSECANLGYVNLPGKITEIKENTFTSCISLSSIIIPEGVTSIESGAFEDCRFLSEITMPSSLRIIGDNAFSGNHCVDIKIPSGVTEIGDYAFNGYGYLETLEIPSSVTSIGEDIIKNYDHLYVFQSLITPAGSYADKWAKEKGLPITNN